MSDVRFSPWKKKKQSSKSMYVDKSETLSSENHETSVSSENTNTFSEIVAMKESKGMPTCDTADPLGPDTITLDSVFPASPSSPVEVDKMPARGMMSKMDSVADRDTNKLVLQKEVLTTSGKQKMKEYDMIEIIVTKKDATNFVEHTSVAVIGFFSDRNCKIVEDFIKHDKNDSVKFATG